jgi:hypothetical protein
VLDIDGLEEIDYRITPAGLAAMADIERSGRRLPPLRDKRLCTNQRYRGRDGTAGEEEGVEIVEDEEVVERIEGEGEAVVIDGWHGEEEDVMVIDESEDEEVGSATSDD